MSRYQAELASCLFHDGFMLGVFSGPEDGCGMFKRRLAFNELPDVIS
jgi:hypothetical protein